MRILFWGTPGFAVPSLRALIGEGHEVVAVVTQPDRPAGRGRELREPPVKTLATDEMIPVFQPVKARDPDFIDRIRHLAPEISVVIAYGQILTREVLEIPEKGSINAHASLLPELRGAAPINWAIVRGYQKTGVTVMRMVEKMDAGPMLFQVEEPIGPDGTATDLWTRLSEISAAALVESLALIESGQVSEQPQDDARATFAPRITREDARVGWDADAASIANLMRGMDAVPGAWTLHRAAELKVFRPLPLPGESHKAAPGTILEADELDAERGMVVACGDGAIAIREVKPAGKRRMTASEWLRGRSAAAGEVLGA
ncbi:MAG: methionyl-tRNA formyltransferase [Gemmatimonadota bacterium]